MKNGFRANEIASVFVFLGTMILDLAMKKQKTKGGIEGEIT